MKRASVAFVIFSLEPGGAERQLANMANHWAGLGWDVAVLTLREDQQAFYHLDERIRHESLRAAGRSGSIVRALANNAHRIRALRQALRAVEADVVISFMTSSNIRTLLASAFTRQHVIVFEATLPSRSVANFFWRVLRRVTYPFADRLIVQTHAAAAEYWPSMAPKIRVIANPVTTPAIAVADSGPPAAQPYILAVGRLERVKQSDHILRAFARLADQHSAWRLVLAGDGSERPRLEALARDLGIGPRVTFTGFVSDVERYYRHAGLFAMSSEYEGMPNAMMEAMSWGLAVVSYNSPGGVRDLIDDGKNGVLVEAGNVEALSEAMAQLLGDPERRSQFGQAAMEIRTRCAIGAIMKKWEAEVCDLVDVEVENVS